MKSEVENALQRTQTGKYLAEACKNNPEMTDAVEAGYADGVRAEREKQLPIDRVGSEKALHESDLLAQALVNVRKVRDVR